MVNAAIFPVSRCGQRNGRRAPNLSGLRLALRHDAESTWLTVLGHEQGEQPGFFCYRSQSSDVSI